MKPDTLYKRMLPETDNFMKGATMVEYWMNGCRAVVAIGKQNGRRWATVYEIFTEPKYRNKGAATGLLKRLKASAEANQVAFRLWCPMNETITHICEKCGVETI